MRQEIVDYYDRGEERDRLTSDPRGWLERERTKAVLRQVLPPPPARVLDVGGGAGVYAGWLAGEGYQVHLVDPVPLHVEQAREHGGFTAAEGDARALAEPDASQDAVLLLGPLYHLPQRSERVRALAEAARVVRPGGPVCAAAITRWAGVCDALLKDGFADPRLAAAMRHAVATGEHTNPGARPGWFTTAYFHRPDDLPGELTDAGLTAPVVRSLEGLAAFFGDLDAIVADPRRRADLMHWLSDLDQEPTLRGAGSHLLAHAHRPT